MRIRTDHSSHMISLDRTNVVQSALGKWVLNNQLRQIGVLGVKESVDDHAKFLHMFRNRTLSRLVFNLVIDTTVTVRPSDIVWADNADVVSRAYSGTGALKTDYTR